MINDASWKVIDGEGNENGPYSTADLQEYYQSGHINHENLVWAEGLVDWTQAGEIEGLLPELPVAVELVGVSNAPAQPVQGSLLTGAGGSGGINLSPTLAGTRPSDLDRIEKPAAPSWLSGINIGTCIGALLLFFLPWVEMGCSEKARKDAMAMAKQAESLNPEARVEAEDSEIPETLFVQTGIQTLTGKISPSKEAKSAVEKQKTENDASGNSLMEMNEDGPGSAILVLGALICLGIAFVLGIIVFTARSRSLLFSSQILCTAAAILIAIQIVVGFPCEGGPGAKEGENAEEAKAILEQFFEVKYTPWLMLEVGLLGSSLLFFMIGLSVGNTPKVTFPGPTKA